MSFTDLTDDLPARLFREEYAGWEAMRDGRAAAYFGSKLTSDAAMVLPEGVLDRHETIQSLHASSWDAFELHEPRLVRLGDHAGVLVCRAVVTAGEDVYEAWISTTYLWQDGGWKVATRQEIPLRWSAPDI
jgi:Domain of unknown function (DUF4440)